MGGAKLGVSSSAMAPLAALPWLAVSAARASAPTAAAAPAAGLTLSVYDNTAAAGPPVSTSSLPSPAAVFAQPIASGKC